MYAFVYSQYFSFIAQNMELLDKIIINIYAERIRRFIERSAGS